jgi:hypothetical protein
MDCFGGGGKNKEIIIMSNNVNVTSGNLEWCMVVVVHTSQQQTHLDVMTCLLQFFIIVVDCGQMT